MRKLKNIPWICNILFCCLLCFPLNSTAKTKTKTTKAKHQISQVQDELFSTSVRAMYGTGSFIEKDKSIPISEKKLKIDWVQSTFTTDNLSSLRLEDLNSGIWSILPSSQFEILDTAEQMEENPFKHSTKLDFGLLRLKVAGASSADDKANITVETNELKVFVPSGSDVVISRQKDLSQDKYITKVYSLNGSFKVLPNISLLPNKENAENKPIPIGPGLLFSMSESGTINPFTSPRHEGIEQVLAFTTTREELLARQHYADGYDINELLEKCTDLEKKSDFFEILNLLEAFKSDYKNNFKIPYFLGIANEGLNQNKEAIQYLTASIYLNPNDVDTHWHLALVYLQEKNYEQAKNELEFVHKNIPQKDPRFSQYNYYVGVINFFEEKYLEAKSFFTNCSEDNELDPALRQSAAEYLSKITVDKPWSLVVPLGLTYDDNVLSLARNESLPSNYTSRSEWKTFMGGIFDYDASVSTMDTGWFFGGEAKSFYVHNLELSYKSLDALIVEGSLFETKRWQGKEDKDSFKLYETNGVIYLDQYQNTYYFLAGIKYKYFDINAGYNLDITDTLPEEKNTNFVFNQYYADSYGQFGPLLLNMNSQLQEKLSKNKNDYLGNSLETVISPSVVLPINQESNISFTQVFDFTWTDSDLPNSVYKFSPTLTLSYFVTKWLLGSLSGVYDYSYQKPDAREVLKPQATLSFTGIF